MSIELINLSMVKLGMVFAQMTERYKALYRVGKKSGPPCYSQNGNRYRLVLLNQISAIDVEWKNVPRWRKWRKKFMKEQFYKTTYFGLIFMIIYPIGTVIYRQLAWNLACSSWRQFRNFWFDKKFHIVLQAQKTGDFWCHWLSVTVSKRASLSALHNWRLENNSSYKECNLDCFRVFHAKFHNYSSKNVGVMGSNSWGKKF